MFYLRSNWLPYLAQLLYKPFVVSINLESEMSLILLSISFAVCEMPGFRYELMHDLALATETAASRPNKPAEWESVAAKLSKRFSTEEKPVVLKGRGCRERLELLLKKHQDDDKNALKR